MYFYQVSDIFLSTLKEYFCHHTHTHIRSDSQPVSLSSRCLREEERMVLKRCRSETSLPLGLTVFILSLKQASIGTCSWGCARGGGSESSCWKVLTCWTSAFPKRFADVFFFPSEGESFYDAASPKCLLLRGRVVSSVFWAHFEPDLVEGCFRNQEKTINIFTSYIAINQLMLKLSVQIFLLLVFSNVSKTNMTSDARHWNF